MNTRTKKQQVADSLRQQIETRVLAPGDLVPTEDDLMEDTGFSRDTVRAALTILENEGRVGPGGPGTGRRKIVIGRQLLTINVTTMDALDRRRAKGVDAWMADVEEQGQEPDQEITIGIEKASPPVASALGVEPGTPVIARKRARTINGRPHNEDVSYYREGLAETAPRIKSPDDIPEGVVAYMAAKGIVQVEYVDETEARMPDPGEMTRLNIGAGVPVLVYRRTGYTEDGSPVRFTVTVWPSDRVLLRSVVSA